MDIKNERISGIEVKAPYATPMYFFCVYMPSENNIDYYQNTLSDLQSLVSFYLKCGNILFAVDYNGQVQTDNTNRNVSGCLFKTKLLTKFVKDNKLTTTNMMNLCTGPNYSFIPTKSMIDYIFVESTMVSNISKAHIVNKQER